MRKNLYKNSLLKLYLNDSFFSKILSNLTSFERIVTNFLFPRTMATFKTYEPIFLYASKSKFSNHLPQQYSDWNERILSPQEITRTH